MSRKTIELREGVYAVVEPADLDDYEGAGARTLVRFNVVEIRATKDNVREE